MFLLESKENIGKYLKKLIKERGFEKDADFSRAYLKEKYRNIDYTEDDLKSKFSSLYNAFRYGAPPHAGMAPGIDRMIMLLTGDDNIREVIAFPMNSNAQDLLLGAPSPVTEQQLREALQQIPGQHMMILGKPSAEQKTWTEGNIEFHTHLATNDFAEAVKRADFVVSRGGYSTVMDMAELGAKCIFVPTPGQFEQIVLAHDLSKAGYAVEIPADELSAETLTSAFEKSVKMPKVAKQNLLHDAVEDVVRKFKERSI